MIENNLKEVSDRIGAACKRAGRSREDVTLVAVSKTKPVSMLMEAYAAGVRDFGENRVQEILEKAPLMPDDIRWHMIGHLQTNKVRQVIDRVVLIHSVDSVALARQIEKEAAKRDLVVHILLEVNVAGEESKFGFSVDEAEEAAVEIAKFAHVRIDGLMTIAPFVENSEENRDVFQKLFQLSVDIKRKNIDNVKMDVLSMGMTGDFEKAVEEGASVIRVGAGIFGARTRIGEINL
ncbi:YggS family pyridoxal phosphate-dependent enzyme [Otoolea muris]|uniref:YggS family pyridoxal phosphate-dependent enzyme n=1 Tax=Otoolea muris TaxID=2941515 RepID=UPI00203DA5A2|nr:YggS family pyridoxal phosphate-dependent enzyme [Otoolea muris]